MKHVIETFKSAFGGRFVLVMMGFVPAIYLFLVFFTGGIDAYKLFTFIIAPLIFCLFCFISAACTRSSKVYIHFDKTQIAVYTHRLFGCYSRRVYTLSEDTRFTYRGFYDKAAVSFAIMKYDGGEIVMSQASSEKSSESVIFQNYYSKEECYRVLEILNQYYNHSN